MKPWVPLLLALSAVPALAAPRGGDPGLRLVYSSDAAGEIEPCG